ncbi:Hsp20/alpha crystallin family protein [Mycobacterium noviomagense]|nr:Hsp20/alpha crystallin family protein [Mycobacterium noviomagense]ORB11577.1 heat-shock protein Hsp18 [Mycobacterium noviomagense]
MTSLLDPFVDDLDRLSARLPRILGTAAHPALMRMDAWRDGDTMIAELDVPGINANSLDVTVERGVLTVRAEREEPADGDRVWVTSERPHGVFIRQFYLNEQLDSDRISADYTNGVLRLTIPLDTAAKARKIAIEAGRRDNGRTGDRQHLHWARRWLRPIVRH